MRAKKYIIIYAVAIFFIVFLITFNSICAITQFEVKYDIGSSQMEQAAQRVQTSLEKKYLNKSFLFFKDSNIRDVVAEEGNGYLEITKISRSFPNKIAVTVREKFENYAFLLDDRYYVVGDDGTVLAVSEENHNNVAGRNMEIIGFEFEPVKVGETFSVKEEFFGAYEALNTVFSVLSEKGLRGNITRIEYSYIDVSDPQLRMPMFILDCIEGLQIRIDAPETRTKEKAEKAFSCYLSLHEEENYGDFGRLGGHIDVLEAGGEIKASYSPEELPEIA